jgi:DNA-binding MarR family transcriptional regulator
MSERAQTIATITETFPEIMHRLIESRPLRRGEFELTLAQLRALRAIGRTACTMGELARQLGISLSAATGLADRLVQHGLIERKPDPQDRRIVRVEMARAGKLAHAAARKEKQRLMEAALEKLSRLELAQIAESLVLLHAALEESQSAKKEKKG